MTGETRFVETKSKNKNTEQCRLAPRQSPGRCPTPSDVQTTNSKSCFRGAECTEGGGGTLILPDVHKKTNKMHSATNWICASCSGLLSEKLNAIGLFIEQPLFTTLQISRSLQPNRNQVICIAVSEKCCSLGYFRNKRRSQTNFSSPNSMKWTNISTRHHRLQCDW